MKGFRAFADHPFGSWVVNGLAVVAFILVLKILGSRLPESGVPGAVRGAIQSV
jgi:hypothetical protein